MENKEKVVPQEQTIVRPKLTKEELARRKAKLRAQQEAKRKYFEFYDENEILKDDILGDFSKYLNLYKESVSKMQSIIHNRVVELETKPVDGVFPSDVSANLKASAKIFDKNALVLRVS